MARGQKGAGSVFQRTYRDACGRKRRTRNWYVEYVVGGRAIREATEYDKRSDAVGFLKKRVSGFGTVSVEDYVRSNRADSA